MDFVDAVLYIMYVVFALATGGVLWSAYRRNRRGAGKMAMQNGIHARRLNITVWVSLPVIAALMLLVGDGSAVDAIVLTLSVMLFAALAVVCWSLIGRR